MNTIYLDQMFLQYFSGRFPEEVDAVRERAALSSILSNPKFRIVLSQWHIWETADGTDGERVLACAEFLDSITNAWYIPDHPLLIFKEVEAFVFRYYWNEDVQTIHPFAICLSQLFFDMRTESVPTLRLYLSPGRLVRYYNRYPKKLESIYRHKRERPDILEYLQRAKLDGSMDANFNERMDREMLQRFQPERHPSGRKVSTKERSEIQLFLRNETEWAYAECPALRVDAIMADLRTNDYNRKPREGDAFDLMHAVAPLSYCSAFITLDGYLLEVASRAKKRTQTACVVKKSLASALEELCVL